MATNGTIATMPSGFLTEVFQPPLHALIAIFHFFVSLPANLPKLLHAVPGFVINSLPTTLGWIVTTVVPSVLFWLLVMIGNFASYILLIALWLSLIHI